MLYIYITLMLNINKSNNSHTKIKENEIKGKQPIFTLFSPICKKLCIVREYALSAYFTCLLHYMQYEICNYLYVTYNVSCLHNFLNMTCDMSNNIADTLYQAMLDNKLKHVNKSVSFFQGFLIENEKMW